MTGRDGLFIAFEGGDGAGKSTQVRLLARGAARPRAATVVVTRQPGGTELGAAIRDLVLHGDHVSPRAEALLFAADKAHHVDQLVRPALERGEVVITDRYTDSSVAYQGAGRDLGAAEVHDLQMWAVDGLVPALTVVVDITAAEGRRRRGDTHDRLESEEDAFHDAIRQHFLSMAAGHPERYLVVDGTEPPERLHDAVMTRLEAMGLVDAVSVWRDVIGQESAVATLEHAVRTPGGDDPRVAVHRAARVGPLGRRPRLRRRAAVPRRRLRRVPRVPHRAGRHPRRRRRHRHRGAVDQGRAGPRPRRARGPPPLGRAVPGDHRRGCRPAHRARRRRPAQGARGAGAAHRVDAVRPLASRTSSSPSARARGTCGCAPRRSRPSPTLLTRRDGVDPPMALYAARAAQSHVGLAAPAGPRRARPHPAPRRHHPGHPHRQRRRRDRRGQRPDDDRGRGVGRGVQRARRRREGAPDGGARRRPDARAPSRRTSARSSPRSRRSRRPGPPGSPATSSTGRWSTCCRSTATRSSCAPAPASALVNEDSRQVVQRVVRAARARRSCCGRWTPSARPASGSAPTSTRCSPSRRWRSTCGCPAEATPTASPDP